MDYHSLIHTQAQAEVAACRGHFTSQLNLWASGVYTTHKYIYSLEFIDLVETLWKVELKIILMHSFLNNVLTTYFSTAIYIILFK